MSKGDQPEAHPHEPTRAAPCGGRLARTPAALSEAGWAVIFREERDREPHRHGLWLGGVAREHGFYEMVMKIATSASVFCCDTSWSWAFKDGIEFVTN